MRLLLNACFGRAVERGLIAAGHDVVFSPDIIPRRTEDPEVLGTAYDQQRVCVTLDDGYKRHQWPERVQRDGHPGIIIVRITGKRMETYCDLLIRFLGLIDGQDTSNTIFVVRQDGYERRGRDGSQWVAAPLLY